MRVTGRAYNQVKLRVTQFALQVAPEVGLDARELLVLPLAIGPLAKALEMNEFHGPSTFARRDEWVPSSEVFFFVQADAADTA